MLLLKLLQLSEFQNLITIKEQAFLKARVAQNELSVEIGEASGLRVLACTGGSAQHGLYTHTWELVEHFCTLQKGPRDVLLC